MKNTKKLSKLLFFFFYLADPEAFSFFFFSASASFSFSMTSTNLSTSSGCKICKREKMILNPEPFTVPLKVSVKRWNEKTRLAQHPENVCVGGLSPSDGP